MERHFAFLPYLKTSDQVHYRQLVFLSTENLAGLESSVAKHVRTLASMFFLRDDLRIQNLTCAVIEGDDASDIQRKVSDLAEFQALIRYIYSSPHPIFGKPFLTSEHGSTFLFHPERISQYLLWDDHNVTHASQETLYETPDERSELAGYAGYLDGRSPLWVAEGSRVYPPTAHLWLNISQDLYTDIAYRLPQSSQAALFHFFMDPRRDERLVARMLSALRWYNRSLALDVEEDQALVSLAIAFEGLLNLPRGRDVTERFKQAVALLLGPVARLDSFLDQFYDVRSDLVHSGSTEDFMFRATDGTARSDRARASRYRSLSSYARHIFQLCLTTIVYGGHMTSRRGLAPLLRTNAERVSEVSRILTDNAVPKGSRLVLAADLIREMETFRFVPEENLKLPSVLDVVRLAADDFLAGGTGIPQTAQDVLSQLAQDRDTPPFSVALHTLRMVYEALRGIQRDTEETRSDSYLALATLIDTAWGYTFPAYFQGKRTAEDAHPDESSSGS